MQGNWMDGDGAPWGDRAPLLPGVLVGVGLLRLDVLLEPGVLLLQGGDFLLWGGQDERRTSGWSALSGPEVAAADRARAAGGARDRARLEHDARLVGGGGLELRGCELLLQDGCGSLEHADVAGRGGRRGARRVAELLRGEMERACGAEGLSIRTSQYIRKRRSPGGSGGRIREPQQLREVWLTHCAPGRSLCFSGRRPKNMGRQEQPRRQWLPPGGALHTLMMPMDRPELRGRRHVSLARKAAGESGSGGALE